MLVNEDFSRYVAVTPEQFDWTGSSQPGVERVMLDRLGTENARATSIVRYAPRTGFPHHKHPGGEEILVLSGTFSDEEGDYPAGWYLRNPPGSFHRPFSLDGTVLFVKLWQMPDGETHQVRIDTHDPSTWHKVGERDICPLFSQEKEQVRLIRLPAGDTLFSRAVGSAELLVLSGELRAGTRRYPTGSWLRLPAGDYPEIAAHGQGVLLYLKTGHLDFAIEK